MKPEKILLIISLILILLLLFLSSSIKPKTIQGKIKQITYNTNRAIIQLENNQTQIIIFTDKILNLKQGQNTTASGKYEVYKNQTQFIANKIIVQE